MCDKTEYPIAFMTFSVEPFVHLIDWKLKKSVNGFHHVRVHSVYMECMRCAFVGQGNNALKKSGRTKKDYEKKLLE